MQEVHVDPGAADDRVIVNTTDEQEQTLIPAFGGAVFVLGPTFVQINGAEATDRLRLNGRGGDDLISTSTDAMRMALDGGTGTNVLLGGPGDDHLLGGADFDDIAGGRGDDVADMGPDFDRFTWRPGDGDDVVNGQGGRDSMLFSSSSDAEAFDLAADGRRLRFTRDVGNIVMDVDVEVVDSTPSAAPTASRSATCAGPRSRRSTPTSASAALAATVPPTASPPRPPRATMPSP